ncbi:MAG: bifunctional 5,10-methylenetetrahydrofolate dehydrogenase/5,10-methenyltetrahydrofolate cyclohydrolase [Eggerthellaceae bacterium]|nr:bifunctional 5,10-methylenetetrahydrofolate dehydrogenase/5,10-methenyltetrahydrofolate cyclohydrolase [Eggerthellaceae bacterium]
MPIVLSGKQVAAAINEDVAKRASVLADAGKPATLALLRIGERSDDLSYERSAIKRAEALGIAIRKFELPADADDDAVLGAVKEINEDASIHGCLMFCPLPKHLNAQAIMDALLPEKDIDGIGSGSFAAIFSDRKGFAPCTAAACLAVLDYFGVETEGKRVVVVGRSLVIGKPVSMMLLRRNATVTICHSRSKNLSDITKEGDIVVCATGRAKAYGKEYFREGQVILDVGVNFDEQGNMCGDVDFDDVSDMDVSITPVPGGIGSVTTAILMQHVVEAAEA